VLEIEEPEIKKAPNTWCRHCRPGHGGCSIYEQRPPVCRGFRCQWLHDTALGDEWFPQVLRMVLHFAADGEMPTMFVHVDKRYPGRWRQEPYYSRRQQWALEGLQQGTYKTIVHDGSRRLMLLGRSVFEDPGEFGVVVPVAPDDYAYVRLQSDEQIRRFRELAADAAEAGAKHAAVGGRSAGAAWRCMILRGEIMTAAIILLMLTGALPVPKTGSCPSGYFQSSSYYAPMSDKSPAAIPKVGTCPSKLVASAYCIESESQR
jgi:hypothetical protein